jgi:small-conductance mechanosensitive channel
MRFRLPSRRPFLLSCLLSAAVALPAIAAPPEAAPAPTPTAAASAPEAGDAGATQELQDKLATDEDLSGITASVDGGVARLDGTVLNPVHRQEAGKIATATPGVAKVVNNVEVDDSLHTHFSAAWSKVTAKLAEIVAMTPLLLVALLVVMLASWLGGVLSRNLRILRLRTDNPYMDGLFRRTVRVLVTLVGVVLALNLLGLSSLMGAVLGSAGVVGLALGFAFKDIAENYIAGVLLSVRKPFSPGEQIRVDSYEGKVVALTSRATILMTPDGNQLQLPNSLVFKSVLLNLSQNPKRRFDFKVTIDPGNSIRQSQTLALEAYSRLDGVLEDPAPSWTVVENGPGGIQLQFFGWVDQRASDLGKVRSEAIRLVKAAFARAGIQSPRTVYHILTAREPEPAGHAAAAVEPGHAGPVDTSVNRDLDEQLAQAQREGAAANLLGDADEAGDGGKDDDKDKGTP